MSKHYGAITPQTFLAFGFFRHIPKNNWEIRVHDNIEANQSARINACLVGICEVLSSMEASKDWQSELLEVEIPPDTGLNGFCNVRFDCETRTAEIRSIMTANKMVSFRLK